MDQRKLHAKKVGRSAQTLAKSMRVKDAGFSARTLSILTNLNVKMMIDIKFLDIEDLRKNSNIGKNQLLEIQRIANQNGINFKLK